MLFFIMLFCRLMIWFKKNTLGQTQGISEITATNYFAYSAFSIGAQILKIFFNLLICSKKTEAELREIKPKRFKINELLSC